ncbi:uncharacterized protein LOC109428109 [Aedes albopictus]|uniref:Odorant receptor n=1 Tax=Aedes albopictus TaxID=7160 RepID=A0ABM2A4I2_AEDAL
MKVVFVDIVRKLKFGWDGFWFDLKSFLLNASRYHYRDLMMIGAGFLPAKYVQLWKFGCMLLYRSLGYYQLAMAIAKTGFGILDGAGLLDILASSLVSFFMLAVQFKVFMHEHYREGMRKIQNFFDGHYGNSGDYDFDVRMRQKANGITKRTFLAMLLLIYCDQLLIWIPNSAQARMFGIPERFSVLGFQMSRILQGMYLCSLVSFWGSRYFCCSSMTLPLLLDVQTELAIVAHGFEMLRANALNSCESHEMRWKYLEYMLKTTVKQHLRVLRHVDLMLPVVNNVYATVYYSNMGMVALAVFLAIRSGMTFMSFCLIITAVGFMIECYSWCFLIGLIQETMLQISSLTAQLAYLPQHSAEHHSQYVQWRTSLMIIQLNASQIDWFQCGHLFYISTESFGELCMIVYRFATFLLKFA